MPRLKKRKNDWEADRKGTLPLRKAQLSCDRETAGYLNSDEARGLTEKALSLQERYNLSCGREAAVVYHSDERGCPGPFGTPPLHRAYRFPASFLK
ncbi:hypothetical protein GsuE55_01090 [Geobacillus subterraneus]|uniref:Uncharacterized protein n=1 Tax=Geobacillus subterraneus TaxID=129338 RepID=A0A679FN62_9BACL|nr:hypothetical protein GsuE55_01090 [Geobacillus subterraneus]